MKRPPPGGDSWRPKQFEKENNLCGNSRMTGYKHCKHSWNHCKWFVMGIAIQVQPTVASEISTPSCSSSAAAAACCSCLLRVTYFRRALPWGEAKLQSYASYTLPFSKSALGDCFGMWDIWVGLRYLALLDLFSRVLIRHHRNSMKQRHHSIHLDPPLGLLSSSPFFRPVNSRNFDREGFWPDKEGCKGCIQACYNRLIAPYSQKCTNSISAQFCFLKNWFIP